MKNKINNTKMKKTHFIITLLFLLIVPVAKAQQQVKLNDIDLVVYTNDDTDIKLFKVVNNKYIPVYFDVRENNLGFFYIVLKDKAPKTLEELNFTEEDKLLYIKDLPELDPEEIRKTTYKIIGKWKKKGKETNELALKFLNSDVAVLQELYYGEKMRYGGFGSNIAYEDDTIKRWRVYNNKYKAVIDLSFRNNKHIFLLNDRYSTDHLFIPTKEKTLLISNYYELSELQKTTKYQTPNIENFDRYDITDFFSLVKTNTKYTLQNKFHKQVLQAEYDTITFNYYFIIAKNKKEIAIYNQKFEKLAFENVKAAYLYREGFEILDNSGARYYNSELKEIVKFPEISYMLCGTVSSTEYNIGFDEKRHKHTVTITNGGYGGGASLGGNQKIILNNIDSNYTVSFIDNKKAYYWDENDSVTDTKSGYPHLIKVFDGKKYGIFEFLYETKYSKPQKNNSDEIVRPPFRLKKHAENGKKILPIVYDAIEMNYDDGLIYFYKDTKVGIFPRDTKVQYNSIEQVTNSFYSVERDGKDYWLDINTNKEYLQ